MYKIQACYHFYTFQQFLEFLKMLSKLLRNTQSTCHSDSQSLLLVLVLHSLTIHLHPPTRETCTQRHAAVNILSAHPPNTHVLHKIQSFGILHMYKYLILGFTTPLTKSKSSIKIQIMSFFTFSVSHSSCNHTKMFFLILYYRRCLLVV